MLKITYFFMNNYTFLTSAKNISKDAINFLTYRFSSTENNQILDPLSCHFRMALLSFKQPGTKISINNNKISFHNPNILQGPLRWSQGDKKTDLHNLYNPLQKGCEWYGLTLETRILFKKSREGLLLLQKSYSNVSESICHSLQYYIDMINKKLSLTKGENLLIDNDNTQDDSSSNRRSISSELKSFWNENMIIIICKLIDELDKTNDEQDRDSIINSIESILDSKDRHLKTIVEKYSSTIV